MGQSPLDSRGLTCENPIGTDGSLLYKSSESLLSVLGIALGAGDTTMGKKVDKRLDPQQPTFLEGTGK